MNRELVVNKYLFLDFDRESYLDVICTVMYLYSWRISLLDSSTETDQCEYIST
jgi:hypothetical protein